MTKTEIRRADPEAWSLAVLYANGDVRRLKVSEDGQTVTVLNRPRGDSR